MWAQAAFATSEPHIVNKPVTCSDWGIETKKCRPPPRVVSLSEGAKAHFAAGFAGLSAPGPFREDAGAQQERILRLVYRGALAALWIQIALPCDRRRCLQV